MRYRELGRPGRPGLRVSEIGVGTRAIGGTVWVADGGGAKRPLGLGRAKDEESLRMFAHAVDLGVNFILASPAHGAGHAEEVVAKAIRSDRDHWVLGVMGGVGVSRGKLRRDFSFRSLAAALHASLRRLGTADVDVFMLEEPTKEEIARGDCIEALLRIRDSGMAGFVGLDIARAELDMALVRDLGVDVVGIRYNLFEPQAGNAFAAAHDAGIGVIADGALADGFLAGAISGPGDLVEGDERSLMDPAEIRELIRKASTLDFLQSGGRSEAQAALLYVLANQAVSVALTGASSADEIEDAATAGRMPRLDEETMDRIRKLQRQGFRE